MNYFKKSLTFFIICLLNILLLNFSEFIDIEQFMFDVVKLNLTKFILDSNVEIFIGLLVTFTAFILNSMFKPFIEIYIQHYLRFSFYFLINLLSVSTVFIALRVYGYSRGLLLLYVLSSSLVFYLDDKNYLVSKFKNFFIFDR